MYTISHKFGNSNDIYGYGYFAYIEDGQLVIGESWPREGGITYRGTYKDAKNRLEELKHEDELLYSNIVSYYSKHTQTDSINTANTYTITAAQARAITEKVKKPKDPWNTLFNKIKECSKKGGSVCTFDEEVQGVYFLEHRKKVKETLELLGYTVTYSRVMNSDTYNGIDYHNVYVIRW